MAAEGILGRSQWDAEALRDIVRDYVVETQASEDAVLVIDETGFLKQGKASCGVSRQYTGPAGCTVQNGSFCSIRFCVEIITKARNLLPNQFLREGMGQLESGRDARGNS